MKSKIEDYRNGANGALLDEYEKALNEIVEVMENVSQQNFEMIVDSETKDPDCRSIQTIMYHVVNAGYGYCYYVRKRDKQDVERIFAEVNDVTKISEYVKKMFSYVVDTSESLSIDLSDGKAWEEFIFRAPWAGVYDLEQIMEHAIVHVLRHRRQIEKFIIQQNR